MRRIAAILVFVLSPLVTQAQYSGIEEILERRVSGGLVAPYQVALDGSDNVFVTGFDTHNVFRVSPGGAVDQLMTKDGDGSGHLLLGPDGIAVDSSGNAYVTGRISDNVFKIAPGGATTQILDATGDGMGNTLDEPRQIAVDAAGTVYVAGFGSDNAFEISPGGVVSQIIDATGDGVHGLDGTSGIAMDGSGNVFFTGVESDNAFKITPGGTITEILDAAGAGGNKTVNEPKHVAADAAGNAYVTSFRITGCSRSTRAASSPICWAFSISRPRASRSTAPASST